MEESQRFRSSFSKECMIASYSRLRLWLGASVLIEAGWNPSLRFGPPSSFKRDVASRLTVVGSLCSIDKPRFAAARGKQDNLYERQDGLYMALLKVGAVVQKTSMQVCQVARFWETEAFQDMLPEFGRVCMAPSAIRRHGPCT